MAVTILDRFLDQDEKLRIKQLIQLGKDGLLNFSRDVLLLVKAVNLLSEEISRRDSRSGSRAELEAQIEQYENQIADLITRIVELEKALDKAAFSRGENGDINVFRQ